MERKRKLGEWGMNTARGATRQARASPDLRRSAAWERVQHTLQIDNNTTRLGRPVPPDGLGTLCFGSPTSILKHCEGSERGPWSQPTVQTSTRQLPRWSPLLASSSSFLPQEGRSSRHFFVGWLQSILHWPRCSLPINIRISRLPVAAEHSKLTEP